MTPRIRRRCPLVRLAIATALLLGIGPGWASDLATTAEFYRWLGESASWEGDHVEAGGWRLASTVLGGGS